MTVLTQAMYQARELAMGAHGKKKRTSSARTA